MVSGTGVGLELMAQGFAAMGRNRQQAASLEAQQAFQREMEKRRQLYQQGLIEDERTYADDREKAEATRRANALLGIYAPQETATGLMEPIDPSLQDLNYSPKPDTEGGDVAYGPVMESSGLYSQLRPETQGMIDVAMMENDPATQALMLEQIQPLIEADRQEAIATEGLTARMSAYQMMTQYESPEEFFSAIDGMDISSMSGTALAGFLSALDPIVAAEALTRFTTMGQLGVEGARLGMRATEAGIANTQANTAYTQQRMREMSSGGGSTGGGGGGSGGSRGGGSSGGGENLLAQAGYVEDWDPSLGRIYRNYSTGDIMVADEAMAWIRSQQPSLFEGAETREEALDVIGGARPNSIADMVEIMLWVQATGSEDPSWWSELTYENKQAVLAELRARQGS